MDLLCCRHMQYAKSGTVWVLFCLLAKMKLLVAAASTQALYPWQLIASGPSGLGASSTTGSSRSLTVYYMIAGKAGPRTHSSWWLLLCHAIQKKVQCRWLQHSIHALLEPHHAPVKKLHPPPTTLVLTTHTRFELLSEMNLQTSNSNNSPYLFCLLQSLALQIVPGAPVPSVTVVLPLLVHM